MNSYKNSVLVGASVLAMLVPMMAQAQTATAAAPSPTATADETAGDDIIVQARRRDERLQDVPAVVNAVTSEQVAKLNFRQFQEIQTVVPGLNLSTVANGTGGGAVLRGVNFDINASGNNPTVEFYQNDAPITAGVVLQQVYDIGQIEVLRGPQGTLRGRASPSGSITLTTRKPDLYRAGGYVSATANDIGTMNLNGALSIPIIEGIAAIRVAGLYNHDDFDRVRTISTSSSTDRRDPYTETQSIRVTAVVNPFDALHLEGSFQRLDRRNRGFDQVESASIGIPGSAASPILIRGSDRLSTQEQPRVGRQKYDIFNGRAQLALFGQKLIYQFQHYNQNIDSYISSDTAEQRPNFDFGQTTISRPRSESHEVRLQNDERVLGTFDYVLGVFDNANDVPTNLNVQSAIYFPGGAPFFGALATTQNTAIARTGHSLERSVFGNVTAHIGEATQVSGGLRYITYRSTAALQISGGTPIPDPFVNLKKVIYTASVQHNFTRDLMVYASTGSSFRPGVAAVGDFSLTQSALEKSFLNLPPETSQSYEIGVKSTLFDGRAHANISGFHQTFKNYPYRVPGAGLFYLSTDAGSTGNVVSVKNFNFVGAVPVEVNGVEGEFGFDFSRQFKVNLVAAYSLGKIKNGTIPCNDLNGDGVPDTLTTTPTVAQLQAAYNATTVNNLGSCKVTQRSAFQSPISASLTAEYNHPLNDHIDGYVRTLVSYNGQSQGDPTNLYDNVGSYALTNLYLGVRDPKGQWEINLFAKNLFDDDRVLTRSSTVQGTGIQVLQPPTFRSAAASTLSNTYVAVTTTPPREFGVNMKFSFGSR